MIRITQLKLPINHTKEQLEKKIARTLKCQEGSFTYEIIRQSLDARHKDDKKFAYTIDVMVPKEKQILKKVHSNNIMSTEKKRYHFPKPGSTELIHPPVIVGSGPAGLFCAWYLARAGYRPLVLERGEMASKRKETVDHFWKDGILNPDSNVQFGEGGAGTFSDGKLNTLVKDPNGRNHEVLERFVKAGAPKEIVYQQKPHLGTDVLIGIVETLRHQIEAMGGSFRFETTMTDLILKDGRLEAVEVNHEEKIPAEVCVLALGHSARDTFEMLSRRGVYMEPKSFAVGLRMEHPQSMINKDLYGEEENEILGAASYKVTHTCENGRGVYSFCMCPGGYVVNASSEPGRLAVNGMSYQARDSKNANSALIVTVNPKDFPDETPLGGIAFQRELERKAWELGEGRIPVQLFGDFRKDQASDSIRGSRSSLYEGRICTDQCALRSAKGESAIPSRKVFRAFGKTNFLALTERMRCSSGIESRTSSPVRIVRDQELTANIEGIYPCGEGAGYAGGITTAAMDGIKVAETVCRKYAAIKNN